MDLADLVPREITPLIVGRAERGDLAAYSPLEAESAALSKMGSNSRREQFLMGRIAAHRALAALGELRPSAIGTGAHGEPSFPDAYRGSISHTREQAVALAGPAGNVRCVGIDLQDLRPLREGLAERISSPEEAAWAAGPDSELRTLMLFSAREAIFKALNPQLGKGPGFRDVTLRWDEQTSCFLVEYAKTVELRPEARPERVQVKRSSAGVLSWTAVHT